jgi:hypothetical protein
MTTAITTPLETTFMSLETTPSSRKRLWTGRILTGFTGAFMLFDGITKLFKPRFVVEATVQLGYPESTIVGIGAVLLISTLLYLIPRTSVLGVVLLTAYLGGAIATQVRAEMGAFNILTPVIFAVIAWGGLYLRDARLERLLPLVHNA